MDAAVPAARSVEGATDGSWTLPGGWCWTELRNVGSWTSGGTPKSNVPDYYDGPISWFRITELNEGRLKKAEKTLTVLGLNESSAKVITAPFLMFAMYGASIGKMAISEIDAATNQAIACCSPHELIDIDYLFWTLQRLKGRIISLGRGGAQPNISQRILLECEVPIAPLAEQRRIVARVDALFAEIAEGEAALAQARQGLDIFRRALLRAAVTGELTKDWRAANPVSETGHDLLARIAKDRAENIAAKGRRPRGDDARVDTTSLPILPEGWVWATLDDLAISGPTNGYSPKKSKDGSGTLALKLTATTRGQIDLSDRAVKVLSETISPGSDLFLKSGDLLFQRGNTVEYVGIAAIYEGPSDKYIYPDLMIRMRTVTASMTQWIWRVANSPFGRKYMMDKASGTAGTMPKISGETLRNFPIPVPPSAEAVEILRRVSHALTAASDTLTMLDAEAADAARLKQSILKAAFEGRLVPQDPADEPAGALLARLVTAPPARRANRRRVRKSNP